MRDVPPDPVARVSDLTGRTRRRRRGPYRRSPLVFHRPVPREWRRRLLPPVTRERRPKGLPSWWARIRQLLWSWWLWAGVAIWAFSNEHWGWFIGATLGSIFTHLGAPRETSPTYGLDHDVPVGDPLFLETIVGLTGASITRGNRLTVLQNGDAFYPAMLEAIGNAQASITIEAYIYWHGEVGLEFARALADRARAGVEVKILLDAIGSASIGREILATLEEGPCQLAWFNPLRWRSLGQINYRTHRKTLLVDGLVGFTGGAGIADHWRGQAEDPDHWRDTQLRLEGPAVVPLQTGFAQNWLQATGEVVSGPRFFPAVPACGDMAAQTMLSSPSTGASSARLLHYLSITAARHDVMIANPYFVPDQAAIDTFADAHRRGVRVRVMVAGAHNDMWLARQNSVRLYGRILATGAEVYEFQRTMLHQKTMVVDGRWATVGTTNFDNRSFAFNEESNVSFAEPALVRELVRAYEDDLKSCKRITREAWRRRGWHRRGLEFAASFLQEQA
jgi:cardiolipin synthase